MITKPLEGEYAPYAIQYIKLINEDTDILEYLEDSIMDTEELVLSLPKSKHEYRYAEGKWTIKEMLQHIIDCERIFCYRALRFSRLDQTPLAGFEEDDYVTNSFANKRSVDSLLDEFDKVRNATISMFRSFDPSVYERSGLSNGHNLSVRAIAYIIAGHEMHHMNVYQEKYM